MMMYRNYITLAVVISLGLSLQCSADDFFEQRIRPVLVEQCFKCHSAEANELKGDLHLDSLDGILKGGQSGHPAIVPGKPNASPLLKAIRYSNPDFQMPPKSQLSKSIVDDFEKWIQSGAPFPKSLGKIDLMAKARTHWAFHPAKKYPRPTVSDSSWPKNDIDYFVLSTLEANKLKPSPTADPRTLVRRLSFDLIGLPPSPEEVQTFKSDPSAEAYAALVEKYLASPHYGERWGRHWLDVARYADTKGYVYGRDQINFFHSYVYRDWVVKALNDDMPYNEFVKYQLAADSLSDKGSRENLAAMGFLTLGQRFLGVTPDIIDDRIDTVSRGLMGLTVSCARCHDHKFDPIPIEDYYSLYGVFSASAEQREAIHPAAIEEEQYTDFRTGMQERESKFAELFASKSAELEQRLRAQVDRYLVEVPTVATLPTDDFYEIRNSEDINPTIVRLWDSFIKKQGHDDAIFGLWNRLTSSSKQEFSNDYSKALAEISINNALLKELNASPPQNITELVQLYAKTFKSVDDEWLALSKSDKENPTSPPTALIDPDREALRTILVQDGSPIRVPQGSIKDLVWMFDEPARVEMSKQNAVIETWIVQAKAAPKYTVILADNPAAKLPRVFHRGNPATPGDEVPRQFLELFSARNQTPFKHGSGRAELAEAIANEHNPLTARVIVNRIWGWHFGQGIVNTPSDFGTRSAPPSHPELLDWLALNFIKEGWSLKQLHRNIVLSATYQQSSTSKLSEVNLNESFERDPENRYLWHFNPERLDFESLRDALLHTSGELNREIGGRPMDLMSQPYPKKRTLYGKVDRRFLPNVFRVFDFPNPDMHSPQRANTTVPQQALFLMNNDFVQTQSRAFAKRAVTAIESPDSHRVDWMYQAAYQRNATPEQRMQSLHFIEEAEANTPPTPPKPEPVYWSYGYGRYDEEKGQMASFTPLPHFTGEAFQGGTSWPDTALGWAQLTADGGHPGNDLDHAVIRRWTAPVSGSINIQGRIQHEPSLGDGIRARIISSRHGTLGQWIVHATEADTHFYKLTIEKGDTVDFVVDIRKGLNSDQFLWAPEIQLNSDKPTLWNAQAEFRAPYTALPVPLKPWEKFAQVLLSSNEFLYVD